ncbi:hypothetical protein METBIDRAFT_11767 [Metschnikowia bicuspidata var. bicuspidata NRRL YB-4993]|uniref:Mitochondrial outer membrane transport complex Sam37/metaxin N-terminal domain-containing protein n=1 Tax=Metschnikowia bicuspidata var. bicuspidata NRRL YB-4993 TaxID=869754 RepID=A0A1A0HBF4_9ASCO|nr:hypothetical protein METBIDRAFT_11767 [Metschnikowia bicuspidata var. bicuspidata NRRL YB-4993]OBA21207.1 hypothetical protein METBIDRAFT_11767 [Metschnikowia bicuspidata var. bicuspidata NRRL YB-4993]
MQIPPLLRLVFNAFPLRSYKNEEEDKSVTKEGRYRFIHQESFEVSGRQLTLAVHNIREISLNADVVKFIPTDPTSLAASLLLCYKYKFLLPSENMADKPGHAIVSLSYLASPNGELPMLIETSGDTKSNSKVVSGAELMITDYFVGEGILDAIFDEFLKSLNDLWILILLTKVSRGYPSSFRNLFHMDPEFQGENELSKQIIDKLLSDIRSSDAFSVRYPNVSSNFAMTVNTVQEWMLGSPKTHTALEKVCASKLVEFENLIPQFLCYLSSGDQSETRSKKMIQFRFVSFVICVEYLIASGVNLPFSRKDDFDDAFEYSKRILMQF